jgi:hypothetical protein
MLVPAVYFLDLILAVHILAAIIAFGGTFAYPIFFTAGARLDPGAMPWFFRMMQQLTRRLIYPGLLIVLIAGIYLASKEDQFGAFYVQWGFFAVIALGGVEGAFLAPRVRQLITLSERDLAGASAGPGAPVAIGGGTAASGAGTFAFSAEYQTTFNQLSIGGGTQALIVVVTVFLMATHAGA